MPSLETLAFEAEQEIGRMHAFFPILSGLGNDWALARPWNGVTLGLSLHLTPPTGALVKELSLGGAACVLTDVNPSTTDAGTVHLLRNQGNHVFPVGGRDDAHELVFEQQPTLLVDAGFELIEHALKRKHIAESIRGAVILSRTGLAQLRNIPPPPFPVVNLVDGQLHTAIAHRHGIGEAVWGAVSILTGRLLAGRRTTIVGYGPVGRGIATWAQHIGMAVEVVEVDPIRRLFAHYDGFSTPSLEMALSRADIVVTATGKEGALSVAQLAAAQRELIVLNAGTGNREIDVAGIQQAAGVADHIVQDVVRYTLGGEAKITVLGEGHPLNIVLNSGSPEPLLLHYALLGMVLDWMMNEDLPNGEVVVPADVEVAAARAALQALRQPAP